MNDIRWTQGGCERTSLRSLLVVFAPSTGVSNACKAKNVLLLVQNEECVHKKSSFDWGPPLSTQVDTDVIHMIKWTRPSPFVFAYCKWSNTGRNKAVHSRVH